MANRLSWERDGADWPNRSASKFVRAAGLRWHLQQMGGGPVLLLLHGTGASTHSWRALAPILAGHFTVVAPDLPGHGFTDLPRHEVVSLTWMARAVRDLMRVLDLVPSMIAGHSAGAAIMARMSLDTPVAPRGLVSLNGALLPFHGIAHHVFAPLAKLLVWNPLFPRLFAWRAAHRSGVERLIHNTGSTIEPAGVELYRRLVSSPNHVAAALAMMANWDLAPLAHDLPRLKSPLLLIVGGNDRAIPAEDPFRVRDLLPAARVEYLRGLGHLAHEERPQEIGGIINRFAGSVGVLSSH